MLRFFCTIGLLTPLLPFLSAFIIGFYRPFLSLRAVEWISLGLLSCAAACSYYLFFFVSFALWWSFFYDPLTGVGLGVYLLVGFWSSRLRTVIKALMLNKAGDCALWRVVSPSVRTPAQVFCVGCGVLPVSESMTVLLVSFISGLGLLFCLFRAILLVVGPARIAAITVRGPCVGLMRGLGGLRKYTSTIKRWRIIMAVGRFGFCTLFFGALTYQVTGGCCFTGNCFWLVLTPAVWMGLLVMLVGVSLAVNGSVAGLLIWEYRRGELWASRGRTPLLFTGVLLGVLGFASVRWGAGVAALQCSFAAGWHLPICGTFALDFLPDWGRLDELLAGVCAAMERMEPGARVAPIVLTLAKLQAVGSGYVGQAFLDQLAAANLAEWLTQSRLAVVPLLQQYGVAAEVSFPLSALLGVYAVSGAGYLPALAYALSVQASAGGAVGSVSGGVVVAAAVSAPWWRWKVWVISAGLLGLYVAAVGFLRWWGGGFTSLRGGGVVSTNPPFVGGVSVTPTVSPARLGALRDFPKPHPLGVSGCERADGVTALCQATTPRMRHYETRVREYLLPFGDQATADQKLAEAFKPTPPSWGAADVKGRILDLCSPWQWPPFLSVGNQTLVLMHPLERLGAALLGAQEKRLMAITEVKKLRMGHDSSGKVARCLEEASGYTQLAKQLRHNLAVGQQGPTGTPIYQSPDGGAIPAAAVIEAALEAELAETLAILA